MRVLPYGRIDDGGHQYCRLNVLKWCLGNPETTFVFQEEIDHLIGVYCECSSYLVLDCSGIEAIKDHVLSKFKDAIYEQKKPVVFLNIMNALVQRDLTAQLSGLPYETIELTGRIVICVHSRSLVGTDVESIATRYRTLSQDAIGLIVEEAFVQNKAGPELLRSTALHASGIWDSQRVIGNPAYLTLVAAEIADIIRNRIYSSSQDDLLRRKPRRFLAVSRTSAVIARATLGLDPSLATALDIYEQFGPWHAVIAEFSASESPGGYTYILIGDFWIGGTEARLAAAYASQRESEIALATAIHTALAPVKYGFPFPVEAVCDSSRLRSKPLISFG